jgi:predicted acyltransferase
MGELAVESTVLPYRSPAAVAPTSRPPVAANRLVSLDAYRGFVMLLMASGGLGIAGFVEQHHLTGRFWQFLAYHTDHVQWRGCALWDLIQPSFTFIVGVALPFSLAKRKTTGQSFGWMTFHAFVRSLILIALGIFLRSINRTQTYYTFEDTLTQIGLGYTFAFLLAWTKPRTQAIAVALILLGYWAAFALYPLPKPGFDYASVGVPADWQQQFGLSGFAAHWGKNTNFAAAFDQWFLNLFPREHRFIFNSGGYLTLSFIPTLGTILLGLLAGELLRSREPADKKFWSLLAFGFAGLVVGTILDLTGICPVVKRIWTPSWTIYSAGWCCLLLAAFYMIIDAAGWKAWSFPMVVVGMNSIAMYCMADGGFGHFVRGSLSTHFGPYHVFASLVGMYAPILESAAVLLVLWLVCLWMFRRRIFLRI